MRNMPAGLARCHKHPVSGQACVRQGKHPPGCQDGRLAWAQCMQLSTIPEKIQHLRHGLWALTVQVGSGVICVKGASPPSQGALTGVVIDIQAAGVHHGRGRTSLLGPAAPLVALRPDAPRVRLGARLDGLHGLSCSVVAPQVGGALHHWQQFVDQLQWGDTFYQVKQGPAKNSSCTGQPEDMGHTSCSLANIFALFM